MMDKLKRCAFSISFMVAAQVCTSDPAPNIENAATIRDSAGIRIVELRGPSWLPNEMWQIADTPSTSIGTVDGAPEYQLTNVRGVAELSDGRVVVANAGSMEVRCYASDGRFLWTSGRRGQGPGDYWTLASLSRYRGDSVLIHDFGLRRYSIIAPSGRFARSWSLGLPDESTALSSLQFVGAFADGTLAVSSSPARRGNSPPTVTRHRTRLFWFSPTGEPRGTMGVFPGDEYYEGEGFAIHKLPFARGTRFATSDSGVFAATDDSYEIRQVRRDGVLTMLIRRDAQPRTLTINDIAAERARLRASRRVQRARAFRGMPDSILSRIVADEEKMFSDVPFPATYPAYASLMVDQVGYLWVQEFNPRPDADSAGQRWSIFHPDGRWLGDVRLPPRLTLYDATEKHVLGVQTDDLGVQYVRVFPILGRTLSRS